MENLDLIITVDTSVAHLSGALGRPTWVLLQFVPDWRWFLDSDTTLWYENVRLFRQKEIKNWNPAINEIFNNLKDQLMLYTEVSK